MHFKNCWYVNPFVECFQGISDTLLVFKAKNPQLTSYHVMGESYQADDSLQDAVALNNLLVYLNPDRHTQVSHFYSLESAKTIKYSEIGTNLSSTLVPCCAFQDIF